MTRGSGATGVACAAHLFCTPETLRSYVAEKIIKRLPDGTYDLDDCRKSVLRHLRGISQGRSSASGLDLSGERAKLAQVQTEAVRTKNLLISGELCKTADAVAWIVAILSVNRETFLVLPGKMADAVYDQPRDKTEELLMDEVCLILKEVSDPNNPNFLREIRAGIRNKGGTGTDSTPEADPD